MAARPGYRSMAGRGKLKAKICMNTTKAQTLLEYVILAGIVAAVVIAMGPYLKRGIQAVIKVTSDQLAPQINADQTTQSGYLKEAFTARKGYDKKQILEIPGDSKNYIFDETSSEFSESLTNLGVIEEN